MTIRKKSLLFEKLRGSLECGQNTSQQSLARKAHDNLTSSHRYMNACKGLFFLLVPFSGFGKKSKSLWEEEGEVGYCNQPTCLRSSSIFNRESGGSNVAPTTLTASCGMPNCANLNNRSWSSTRIRLYLPFLMSCSLTGFRSEIFTSYHFYQFYIKSYLGFFFPQSCNNFWQLVMYLNHDMDVLDVYAFPCNLFLYNFEICLQNLKGKWKRGIYIIYLSKSSRIFMENFHSNLTHWKHL